MASLLRPLVRSGIRSRTTRAFSHHEHIFVNRHAPHLNIPKITPNFSDFILDGFEERGEKMALAVSTKGDFQSLSFQDLVNDVHSVAHGFRTKLGFQEGDTAMLISPNHLDFFSAVHGVLKIGGVLSPTNPLNSPKELGNQLRDCGAKVLIAHPLVLGHIKETLANGDFQNIKLVVLGDSVPADAPPGTISFSELKGHKVRVDSVPPTDKDTLALLPYSSGTTGLPKGTMLSHRNLMANVLQFEWIDLRFWKEGGETLISPLPFFHIYGFTASLNVTLWHGCPCITMPAFDMEEFLQLVQDHKCTKAHLVPPIILGLAKHPLVDKYDYSSLNTIISGAAPLGAETEAAAKTRLGSGIKIKQAWGMSELSPVGSCNPDDFIKPGSSGPPVSGMEYKILDVETGEALPRNEIGEVVCRGPNVMVGYLNNPEGTRECLDEDGWLRTGDIGYIDGDDYISFTDRIKELIKYKGFQVPPAELEALLLTHDHILDAAVIPVPDDEAGELPRAFVVLKPGHEATGLDIAAWAAEKTAPHKRLRGGVVILDQIPKSASGKILRRVLVARNKEGEFEVDLKAVKERLHQVPFN